MLTVILWKWRGWRGNTYTAERVHVAARMIRAHLTIPHRIVCITDDPAGVTEVDTYPLWEPPGIPIAGRRPNCWLRLRMFSRWFRREFGDRVLSFDVDAVVLRSLDPLITGHDLRMPRGRAAPYNGSLILHTTGTRPHVWDEFDAATAPKIISQQRHRGGRRWLGSDQCWISYQCPGEATWSPRDDGVVCLGMKQRGIWDNARVVFFAGAIKPWDRRAKAVCPDLWRVYRRYC